MPSFITRVELHNAKPDDYLKLHGAMTAAKFHRFITDDSGRRFQLPTAEYFSHGPDITAIQVRELANAAANSTGKASWILVSQYATAAWNLNPMPAPSTTDNFLNTNYLTSILANNLADILKK